MGMGAVEHMRIDRRLGSVKIEFSPAFSFPIEKMGPISTESFGKMVFAGQGWKAAAIPSVLFSRGLHFSLLPVILFTVSAKIPAGFCLLDVFSHYEWVEVISYCSRADGVALGEDKDARRAASPGRGWEPLEPQAWPTFSEPGGDVRSHAGGE